MGRGKLATVDSWQTLAKTHWYRLKHPNKEGGGYDGKKEGRKSKKGQGQEKS